MTIDDNRKAIHGKVAAAFARKDLDEVETLLCRLREDDPMSVHTRCFELEWMIARKDRAARAAGDALARDFPGSARAMYLAGRAARQARQHALAADRFREAWRIHPSRTIELALAAALTDAGQLDEAEAILLRHADTSPSAYQRLGWLYERRGDLARAASAYESWLQARPDDNSTRRRLEELRARMMEPEEIIQETEQLVELGEAVPEPLVGPYFDALLRAGRGRDARRFVAERRGAMTAAQARSLAWTAYRMRVPDLALDLFLLALPSYGDDAKLRAAIARLGRETLRDAEVRVAFDRYHAGPGR